MWKKPTSTGLIYQLKWWVKMEIASALKLFTNFSCDMYKNAIKWSAYIGLNLIKYFTCFALISYDICYFIERKIKQRQNLYEEKDGNLAGVKKRLRLFLMTI